MKPATEMAVLNVCGVCGEPLPSESRTDRMTCSMRCHVAAWRARGRASRSLQVRADSADGRDTSTALEAVTSPRGSVAA